jgi:hypothetical protein
MMIHVRFDLNDLQNDTRHRDATTDQVLATLRRIVGGLGRLMRSIHGDGRSKWWNWERAKPEEERE